MKAPSKSSNPTPHHIKTGISIIDLVNNLLNLLRRKVDQKWRSSPLDKAKTAYDFT